jgi:hypothetical protein
VAHETESEEDEVLLMVTTTKNDLDTARSWYLDMGCSNHMAYNKNWFVELDEKTHSKVQVCR